MYLLLLHMKEKNSRYFDFSHENIFLCLYYILPIKLSECLRTYNVHHPVNKGSIYFLAAFRINNKITLDTESVEQTFSHLLNINSL